MKRIITIFFSLLLALGFGAAIGPAAQAQDVVTIAGGDSWTTNLQPPPDLDQNNPATRDACTMGVVGTDTAGNKVGISSAHCISHEPDGVNLYKWSATGPRTKIGTVVWRNTVTDFVVFKFDATVQIKSQGPRIRLDGVGTLPKGLSVFTPAGQVCKDGQTSGIGCGTLLYTSGDSYYSTAALAANDSGGPGFVINTTKWVGINRATTTFGFRYVQASRILSDIQAQANSVGKGFTVVNN